MFRSYASRLKFTPENGMKIIASGKISVYERDGQYQLYISAMQPDGVGDLYAAYEQLKAKLQNEGFFDASHKKTIPAYPKTVGVITSPTGAAIRDIINVTSRRFPLAEILICPVLVQGDDSARQIANAIEFMNNENGADVLIVGRGGGSIEDLWSFNEEVVAYAIYNSKIPVISAVGHETDFTIADFVADMRAPTPSAAAELAVPSVIELKATVNTLYNRMLNCITNAVEHRRKVINSFSLKSPLDFINQNRLRTDNCMQKIINMTSDAINQNRMKAERYSQSVIKTVDGMLLQKSKSLAVTIAKLDALSPLKVLKRGYSFVEGKKGNVIQSVDHLTPEDTVGLRFSDGKAECVVKKIIKDK